MEQRIKQLVILCLLGLLAACAEEAPTTIVPPTPTLSGTAIPTIDTEIAPFPPAEGEPTYISVSQFPVAVVDYASAQRPAFASIEMAGFDISELTWQIGRYGEGCNQLVSMGRILPEASESWPDGVHQASFSWPAVGYLLGDGEKGDIVFLEITGLARVIRGRFTQTAAGESVDANLVVDPTSGRIVSLQSTTGQVLTAVAGDNFQLHNQCLQADGSRRSEPGTVLTFLEGGQLNIEQQPLPSGDYFLHLTAAGPGSSASSTTDFLVNNDSLLPEYQVYLNTQYGFQYLYPADWPVPQLQDNRLATGDSAISTSLTVTIHPDMSGQAAGELKNLALSQFGSVNILFEDQISIDETGALWTAYGYSGEDGPHTGVLLTFTRDNIGYTVDMDGLQTAEAQTINLMNLLIDTWLFRPDVTSPRAQEWAPAAFDNLAMPVMANYYHEQLNNGWQRYTVGDGLSFLALRTTTLEEGLFEDTLSDVVERWREVAAQGVTDFAMSDPYTFSLNGREWNRTDFAYLGEGVEIQGFVMAAEIEGRAVVFWAEMPVTRYEEQSARFLLSLAGLR